MGMVYMNKGLLPQAQAFCAQARHLAKENNCADGLAQANYCMEQLKTVIGWTQKWIFPFECYFVIEL